jgi:hypothetical protein
MCSLILIAVKVIIPFSEILHHIPKPNKSVNAGTHTNLHSLDFIPELSAIAVYHNVRYQQYLTWSDDPNCSPSGKSLGSRPNGISICAQQRSTRQICLILVSLLRLRFPQYPLECMQLELQSGSCASVAHSVRYSEFKGTRLTQPRSPMRVNGSENRYKVTHCFRWMLSVKCSGG